MGDDFLGWCERLTRGSNDDSANTQGGGNDEMVDSQPPLTGTLFPSHVGLGAGEAKGARDVLPYKTRAVSRSPRETPPVIFHVLLSLVPKYTA